VFAARSVGVQCVKIPKGCQDQTLKWVDSGQCWIQASSEKSLGCGDRPFEFAGSEWSFVGRLLDRARTGSVLWKERGKIS